MTPQRFDVLAINAQKTISVIRSGKSKSEAQRAAIITAAQSIREDVYALAPAGMFYDGDHWTNPEGCELLRRQS